MMKVQQGMFRLPRDKPRLGDQYSLQLESLLQPRLFDHEIIKV